LKYKRVHIDSLFLPLHAESVLWLTYRPSSVLLKCFSFSWLLYFAWWFELCS